MRHEHETLKGDINTIRLMYTKKEHLKGDVNRNTLNMETRKGDLKRRHSKDTLTEFTKRIY